MYQSKNATHMVMEDESLDTKLATTPGMEGTEW